MISAGLLKLLGALLGVGAVVAAIFLVSGLDLELDLDELTSTEEAITLESTTLKEITLPQPQTQQLECVQRAETIDQLTRCASP